MKLRILLLFSFLLANVAFYAQERLIPKSDLLVDLYQLKTELLQIHPTLHFYASTSDMPSLFDLAASTLPDKMNRIEFLKHISPIIDSLKCGHTSFYIDSDKKILGKKLKELTGLFPFNIQEIEHKIVFTKNLSSDTLNIRPGDELIAINDIPILEIIENLKRLSIGSDANNQSGKVYYILKNFILAYRMFYGEQTQFYLKTRKHLTSEVTNLNIPAQSLKSLREARTLRYPPENNKPFELKKIQGLENIAILDINSFSNTRFDFAQIGYSYRLKKTFKEVRKANYDYLVVDVRNNSGGTIENLLTILKYIHTKPFVLVKEASYNKDFFKSNASCKLKWIQRIRGKKKVEADRIITKGFTNVLTKNRKKNGFKGKVIVLINEGTFSASAALALSLKSSERAVLLGTESGGSYYIVSGGNFKKLELKNSKLKIKIPTLRIDYNVDSSKQDALHGVLPDLIIEDHLSNYLNKVDTQIEAAIQLIQKFELDKR
jgi:C-terminal processing protease CtpA/Prc